MDKLKKQLQELKDLLNEVKEEQPVLYRKIVRVLRSISNEISKQYAEGGRLPPVPGWVGYLERIGRSRSRR